MNREKQLTKERPQSLRVVSPLLYQSILIELEKQNIHSYDVQIDAVKGNKGIHIILKYGESFTHQKEQSFTNHAIEKNSSEIAEFVKKAGETCKEVMINEYFKMMRP